ncbi:hypothetical protein N7495_001471 [Penicillium taxi]|uniref:uncharacterized protein n=1 Tax=Penicillium taxi TaxID=168475 RepID=UPI002544F54E|nr:uncharacterized protein N7495_001471 [Penicillium taxi]KAJ5908789.1 hypothetical protein N7495_001471 [Penicillium taxi]
MAPILSTRLFSYISRISVETHDVSNESTPDPTPSPTLNKVAARAATNTHVYGAGTIDPHSIKMQGLLALFALIGLGFVLGAIWFFFWAKNGGFQWRKGDWDDYKSTVLRRKGPDGRTLSNATKSTKLGGGSIVGYSDTGYTYDDETATMITEKEKPKQKKKKFTETAKERLLRRNKDESWEGEGDDDMRAYREEKPAQIGGMNREADGTYHGSDYDSSTAPSHYNRSDMTESRYEQPRRAKTKNKKRDPSGFSFTAGSEDVLSQTSDERYERHERRERRETRRRERERATAPKTASTSRTRSPPKNDTRKMPGHFTEPLDLSSNGSRSEYQYSNVDTEDSGTKSYSHPIPGLTKGYRRDKRDKRSRRRDSLDDSD